VLILLPPSEGKRAPRRGSPLDLASLSFPDLLDGRAAVLEALTELCRTAAPGVAAGVLGLGSTQAEEVAVDANLHRAPTARADRVYSGVLYEALDLPSLDAPARRRATSWLAVTSGLFGLLRPSDRIPAYRLSGDVTLPRVGTVSTYWGARLDATVRDAAGRGLVVDLRSGAYVPFWRPAPEVAARVVTLRVLQEVGGERRTVSHFNKATKGRLVRDLLLDGSTPRRPARLVELLGDLGWRVDLPDPRRPVVLDVVVGEL
jgi:cytoplasmic iron level regulating protein YaaA (DUF328/UPF0246 family)